ncbi:DUF6942 family protein [Shewanella nanhaiensis]|uniref:Uncharacterized protein n=1 Tax=Shewanella nanhaiensis TaxID=2864872 RepID=A0ABS7E8J5_9GAMM|nr:hypothetical protein [Shewanella nanhaiensis]MBW8185884.1 hypothetical protein [Shewanella nanhaiensis]
MHLSGTIDTKVISLGAHSPTFCFYLPTPPVLPQGWNIAQDDAVSVLIEHNGNHWRKILTIMAKICAPNEEWKHYRDTHLLKHNEMILIGADTLLQTTTPHQKRWHFLVGKVVSQQLSMETQDLSFIDINHSSIQFYDNQSLLITPYLDYRQYPNQLIAETRALIASNS